MIMRHIQEHGVDLRTQTELKEILSDENGKVRAVVASNGKEIACGFVGLTAGVTPNVDFLRDGVIEVDKGVLVNRYLETNVEDVYALGDCAQFKDAAPGRKHLEQVWYTGRMMGEALGRTLAGQRTMYQPGIWFNSAKFFDIEYQTYGFVEPNPTEGHVHFYWEHPEKNICLRIVCSAKGDRVIGINALGMRLRHEICERWIEKRVDLAYVITHLADANFDPELYRTYEKDIAAHYNTTHNNNIKPARRSWKRILGVGIND